MTWLAGSTEETAFSQEEAVSFALFEEARSFVLRDLAGRIEALLADLDSGASTGTEEASLASLNEHLRLVALCESEQSFMIQTEGLIFYVCEQKE